MVALATAHATGGVLGGRCECGCATLSVRIRSTREAMLLSMQRVDSQRKAQKESEKRADDDVYSVVWRFANAILHM